MQWFRTSNICPVCRVEQDGDPIIVFKRAVEENMRATYADAIHTLELEINRHRRRYRRIMIGED
jgi:hypothetical protein